MTPKVITAAAILMAICFHGSVAIEGGGFDVTIRKADHPIGGLVHGTKQCGGPAEFVEFRIEGCEPSTPCHVKTDGGPFISEMDFIPVIDMPQLQFQIEVTVPDGITLKTHDKPIDNSDVVKGQKYTLRITGHKSKGAVKTELLFKYSLLNTADKSLRVCMEAHVAWGG